MRPIVLLSFIHAMLSPIKSADGQSNDLTLRNPTDDLITRNVELVGVGNQPQPYMLGT